MISLLDMTHLAEMREIFGTEGLLELLDLFEEESSGPVDALPQQVPDQLADQLHGLRSSIRNLGLRRLVPGTPLDAVGRLDQKLGQKLVVGNITIGELRRIQAGEQCREIFFGHGLDPDQDGPEIPR